MGRGFLAAGSRWEPVEVPMADGGDGTMDVLLHARGGERRHLNASGPLGQTVRAAYAVLASGEAVVEMAAASGLALLKPDERDPLLATSRGTGELLRHALEVESGEIVLGLGGSATVDGGLGMLQALGVACLDANGNHLGPGGAELLRLRRVDRGGLTTGWRPGRVRVAIDVDSPLLGEGGAAHVFGPQKGARRADVEVLERGLANLAAVLSRNLGVDVAALPGGGAAGGAAAALAALGAELVRGGELVARLAGLERALHRASLAVTAEGSVDRQTATGKAPMVVLRHARAAGIPCVVIAGATDQWAPELGFARIERLAPAGVSREESISRALAYMEQAAQRLAAEWPG
jgi:glycerate kinase